MTKAQIIQRISKAIATYTKAASRTATDLIPNDVVEGKLYEAHILACVVRDLATRERLELILRQGRRIVLKSSPGPINTTYPHIEVRRNGTHVADLWTDIEVTTLSYLSSGLSTPAPGHYHELDIAMVDADVSDRPEPRHLWLGVECKHTPYSKAFLRQILGVRRELSLLTNRRPSNFSTWPVDTVPANPPSCLVVYSSSSAVLRYAQPGHFWGIDFVHEPLV